MIIPDEIRKSVAFIGCRLADGTLKLGGSVFFLGRPKDDGKADPVYWVTARHVIEAIRNKGLQKVLIRANTTHGDAIWVETEAHQWFWSSTDSTLDVAILRAGLPANFDHVVIPYTLCANEDVLKKHEVALGNKIQNGETAVVVVGGDFHHEAEIGFDHELAGAAFPAADTAGEFHFFGAVEERGFPDALEVGLKSGGEILFPNDRSFFSADFHVCFHMGLERHGWITFGLFLWGANFVKG